MKTLNKKLLFSIFLVIIGISSFYSAQALGLKDGFSSTKEIGSFAKDAGYQKPQTPEYYVGLLLTGLFSVLGIVAIALIIYSGVVWMTARGNESKVEKAKENLTDVVIGLIFIIGSYALTMFILKIFS
jgi:hypothetical protein